MGQLKPKKLGNIVLLGCNVELTYIHNEKVLVLFVTSSFNHNTQVVLNENFQECYGQDQQENCGWETDVLEVPADEDNFVLLNFY